MSFPQSSVASGSCEAELSSLVAGVAGGDQNALNSLYDRSSGAVFGLCLRILNEPPVAEEVLLEVFVAGDYRSAMPDTIDQFPSTVSGNLLLIVSHGGYEAVVQ